ncbi:MAG: hypothetical protein ACRCV9_01240 [Burkholderiaceae bacterium]
MQTKLKGEQVAGAKCELKNDKGSWFVDTPGSVTVRRSISDMQVACTKAGVEPGNAAFKSSTKAMAFGNILFGGIIGAGVDVATGAAYDYPSLFEIEMASGAPAPAGATDAASTPAETAKPAEEVKK